MPSRVAAGEGRLPLAGATGNSPVIGFCSYYRSDGRDGRSWLIAIRIEVARTDTYARFWLPVLKRSIRALSFRGGARNEAHPWKRENGKPRTGLPRNAWIPFFPEHVVTFLVGSLLWHGGYLFGSLRDRRTSDRRRDRTGTGTLWHQPLLRGPVGRSATLGRRRRKRPRTRLLRNAVLLQNVCDKSRGTAVLLRRATQGVPSGVRRRTAKGTVGTHGLAMKRSLVRRINAGQGDSSNSSREGFLFTV